MNKPIKAPFPYFGGKSRAAHLVWERFGDVPSYVEPFFGSGAVLLSRPHEPRIETVNDKCGFIANFWRAVSADAQAVAGWADNPVNENDLHARHAWLLAQEAGLVARLEGNPKYYDAQIAGWWCWGLCCWIAGGWCSGNGPWHVDSGMLVCDGDGTQGVNRQLPHLGNAGRGVNRQLPHLGDAGRGVNKGGIYEWFEALQNRLRRVRVCCGDWTRVCGPSVTVKNGLTGVFLDPPYSAEAGRDNNLYNHESGDVAHDAREWAIANGDNPLMRIALCGYEGEHVMPGDWECVAWKAQGGYGSQRKTGDNENAKRERIWFSPNCLKVASQAELFAEAS